MKDLTAVFDMDGVILDSERVYQDIEWNMYLEIGAPVSREEHWSYMGTAESWMWNTVVGKYLPHLDRTKFSSEEPEGMVTELIETERNRFVEQLEAPGKIPFMEGFEPLLDTLHAKGVPCLIASSSARYIIETMIRTRKLEEYFIGYVGGDEVPEAKPAPYVYLQAAEIAGVSPSGCVAIEDSENGIRSAAAAGMPVIGLRHKGQEVNMSEATMIIDSLSELSPDRLSELVSA